MQPTFTCSDCMEQKPIRTDGGTGYGTITEEGMEHRICYRCMAARDRLRMDDEGRITLYLVGRVGMGRNNWSVENWPSTLRFAVLERRIGFHNIARRRIDAWFLDHHGNRWHGVQYGDNTQIIHCRRLKPRRRAG